MVIPSTGILHPCISMLSFAGVTVMGSGAPSVAKRNVELGDQNQQNDTKYLILREGAETYKMKSMLVPSTSGKMMRSRSGILRMMESTEEKQKWIDLPQKEKSHWCKLWGQPWCWSPQVPEMMGPTVLLAVKLAELKGKLGTAR